MFSSSTLRTAPRETLAAERKEARLARQASLQEALCWMLLVPVWTEPLAHACAFPSRFEQAGGAVSAP